MCLLRCLNSEPLIRIVPHRIERAQEACKTRGHIGCWNSCNTSRYTWPGGCIDARGRWHCATRLSTSAQIGHDNIGAAATTKCQPAVWYHSCWCWNAAICNYASSVLCCSSGKTYADTNAGADSWRTDCRYRRCEEESEAGKGGLGSAVQRDSRGHTG